MPTLMAFRTINAIRGEKSNPDERGKIFLIGFNIGSFRSNSNLPIGE